MRWWAGLTKLANWQDGVSFVCPQNKPTELPLPPTFVPAPWKADLLPSGRSPLVVSASQNSLIPFPQLFLWRPPHPSDCSFSSSTSFLISPVLGQAPERAPRFYAVFVFFVYPRHKPSSTTTAKRAPRDYKYVSCSWAKGHVYFPSWTTTWPAAKTKILQCVFFPRNDNYSTPNIFQTSTTKMEKAFQKIIY